MSSINSIFGLSFNESFDFQGFSSRAMKNHNRHSHSRSRERSPHERSSRDSNREQRRRSQRKQAKNPQDHHHYPLLPHLVPREAERLPASEAEVLKIHSARILLQAEIRLSEVNTRMPGVAPMAAIIPPVSTVSYLPVTVSSG